MNRLSECVRWTCYSVGVLLAGWPRPLSAQGTPVPSELITGQMTLPHDLSPWGMFQSADIVVKSVLIGLVFASIVTWTVALAKAVELFSASRRAKRARAILEASSDLADARRQLGTAPDIIPRFVSGAAREIERSGAALPVTGIKERIQLHFERLEAAEARRMMRGTGLLATIGATAPFVGLFGTVWGIMNSFIGISKAHTTNLAVVAPGIAEALLATAVGLAAAIPAVVIYNMFARALAGYRARIADAAVDVLRTAGRDLDRAQAGASIPPRRSLAAE